MSSEPSSSSSSSSTSSSSPSPPPPSADIPTDANSGCVGPSSADAGKASSCAGCPNQSACASGALRSAGPDPALLQVQERLSSVRHKLLILSGKGGVGKSTVSSQLAWGLSDSGYGLGILDIDICGPSVPRMMGVESMEVSNSGSGWSPVYAAPNLAVMSVGFMLSSRNDAIIWRGPRKTGLIKQFLTDVDWGDLDFLIVDAPPGTSDEHISIATYMKQSGVDGAIIVTTPQEVSLLDVRKEINFCKKVHIPILGVVENMSGFECPNCRTPSSIFPALTGGARAMCSEMDVPFLGSIPLDSQLLQCCEEGKSFLKKHPGSVAAKGLKEVIRAILNATPSLKETRERKEKEKAEDGMEEDEGREEAEDDKDWLLCSVDGTDEKFYLNRKTKQVRKEKPGAADKPS